jgi:hypothetical protein
MKVLSDTEVAELESGRIGGANSVRRVKEGWKERWSGLNKWYQRRRDWSTRLSAPTRNTRERK